MLPAGKEIIIIITNGVLMYFLNIGKYRRGIFKSSAHTDLLTFTIGPLLLPTHVSFLALILQQLLLHSEGTA